MSAAPHGPPLVVGRTRGLHNGFTLPADAGAARIAAVTAELASAESLDDVVTAVADHVREAANAAVSSLSLRDGAMLEIAGASGVHADRMVRWSRYPLAQRTPTGDAVLTGAPVVAATPDVMQAEYPTVAPDCPPNRSVVGLPLVTGGEVIGAIGMTFEDNWRPGRRELGVLMSFADACAQTIRRVRATEQAARSAAHLRYLATASAELASSLDHRMTLTKVTQLTVPDFADWCAVHLLDGDRLEPIALAHVDPAKVDWAWELTRRYPTDLSATTGTAQVVRTGVGQLARDITDDMLVAAARDEEHLRLCRELDMRSAIVVPLTARSRTLGALTLIRTTASGNFDDVELTVAEDLARRAAVAIDNARLHQASVALATELQHAVLPAHLPQPDGWQTSGVYRPDGTAEVGGDFYDAVPLRDGRLAVFIGDVMGHGIAAAATMAQMRSSIRALVTVDAAPEAVLARLDDLFDDLALEPLVSVVYALLAPDGAVQVANAGHCAPLLVRADGSAGFVADSGRPPLGTGRRPTRLSRIDLAPRDVLLLYTDGLVERRHESIDAGLDRLCRHAGLLREHPLDTVLPALVTALAGPQPQDDVAALAVRRSPAP